MEANKKSVSFSYRIEAKPGGGFVAHTSDPTMETVEAATREELEQKMQAKINELMGNFGGLGVMGLKKLLGSVNVGSGLSYHIEEHPEGFRAHPSDSKLEIVSGTSREDLEQKIREALGPEAGKKVADMLSRLGEGKLNELGEVKLSQWKLGDVKVTGNVSFTTNTASYGKAFGQSSNPPLIQSQQPSILPPDPLQPNLSQDSTGPILPADQSGGIGKVLLLVLILTALAALIYYALHR